MNLGKFISSSRSRVGRPFTASIPTSIFFTISLRPNLFSIIQALWDSLGQSVVAAGPTETISSQMSGSSPASILFDNTARISSRPIKSPFQIETREYLHQDPQHVTDIATLISEDVLEKCSEATQNAVRASKSFDEVYNKIRLIDRSRHDESFAEPWDVLRKRYYSLLAQSRERATNIAWGMKGYLIALQQEIRSKTLVSLVQSEDANIEQALNDVEDVISFVDGCSRNAAEIADDFHELMVDVQGFQVKMNAFGREYLAQLNHRRQADWSMIENRKQQVVQLNSQIGSLQNIPKVLKLDLQQLLSLSQKVTRRSRFLRAYNVRGATLNNVRTPDLKRLSLLDLQERQILIEEQNTAKAQDIDELYDALETAVRQEQEDLKSLAETQVQNIVDALHFFEITWNTMAYEIRLIGNDIKFGTNRMRGQKENGRRLDRPRLKRLIDEGSTIAALINTMEDYARGIVISRSDSVNPVTAPSSPRLRKAATLPISGAEREPNSEFSIYQFPTASLQDLPVKTSLFDWGKIRDTFFSLPSFF
ncbi:hypothetical protein SISSUDRAFT_1034358 [Sistotremastrum suecicum HHB10207 ss-3]|uniref:Uncharacterized protein n=1 Tax=Sistotremastrum suecicum HHB10207 ss-3 TaxID=1314776 RepID=A0A166C5L1_9AGAM|nr:hypothetical protein SISSUDRAFT_1034358 [Sistotremastrum suecicum HHB10207 ss-3]